MPERHVTTSLWYLKRLPLYQQEKPYFVNFPVPPGEKSPPQHNLLHEKVNGIDIQDIRGCERDFKIDTHGFQIVEHRTGLDREDFANDAAIRARYYPEIIELVEQTLGASRVVPFEHTHRLSRPDTEGCGDDRTRKPLVAPHVDQTPDSSAQRIRYHMGEAAPELLKRRYQIINVWRPLFGPLRDFPLTLGDCRTFDFHRDGEPTDLVFPHYIGESMNLYHHRDHEWFFLSDQNPQEPWIFKCFDSKAGVAIAAPHCSFDIQSGENRERLRESIEIRLMVMYD